MSPLQSLLSPSSSVYSLSKLVPRFIKDGGFFLSFAMKNPNPNKFACSTSRRLFLRFSSSSSVLQESERPSLGNITRRDFPALDQVINGINMTYLGNAATSLKPSIVLNTLAEYYKSHNSNLHGGTNDLSSEANDLYEIAREKVAAFINAMDSKEIIFTQNATEAINLVAYSWGLTNLRSGDEIIITIAEHLSALVPWELITQKTGAILNYVGLTKENVLDIEELKRLLSTKTKLVVTHHVSNTLGSVLPISDIVSWCHEVGAKVLVDACQSVPQMVVDVQKIDADFLVASSHKMCGPTGVGFLYGKSEILSTMPPFLYGGEMTADVFQDHSTFADPPVRFEAGTPAIAEAIGLGAAIDYLSGIGMQRIHEYQNELANYLYDRLCSVPKARIYGPPPTIAVSRAALCSFNVGSINPRAIATCLYDLHGVVICSGHHCAPPLHRFLGTEASARTSLLFYNTKEDVDFFIEALKDTINYIKSFKSVWETGAIKDDISQKEGVTHILCGERRKFRRKKTNKGLKLALYQ